MSDTDNFASPARRTPWNKGKLIGARPPLRSKHVWSIRTRLQVEGRVRDLAMFNLAIDSKLRGTVRLSEGYGHRAMSARSLMTLMRHDEIKRLQCELALKPNSIGSNFLFCLPPPGPDAVLMA
jgi:hypothetical protein